MQNSLSLHDIISIIEDGERRSKFSQIIAVDGPAGAGKTTLAKKIESALGYKSVHVIHMDNLYDGWENALTQTLTKAGFAIIATGMAKCGTDAKGNANRAELEKAFMSLA